MRKRGEEKKMKGRGRERERGNPGTERLFNFPKVTQSENPNLAVSKAHTYAQNAMFWTILLRIISL